ncbi:calcium-binding protein [Paludisphaera rhizosphaerae]|uniref:calcium-binding protein n=1 Tax=Paludisphaera rhizosphaerae TaxID=2711216 RepID=UPI0013EB14FE|nr:calcium-binding protein [Paludisphaera rhizosphaerae]
MQKSAKKKSRRAATAKELIRPGEPFDYRPMAMDAAKWDAKRVSTWMFPWIGRRIALLTDSLKFDRSIIAEFVSRLDAGWAVYADFVGEVPRLFHHIDGRGTIAAVPGELTCGGGCGYLGQTGIEVIHFYADDYPLAVQSPKAFKNYYFYEMGRNYFVFGDRHSQFGTGFAVFMRHVCMEVLKLEVAPGDQGALEWIETLEGQIEKTDLTFLKAFTMQGGLGEKDRRHPNLTANQTDIYASAMMRLRREVGGDRWLRRFYRVLGECPEVTPDSPEGALRQGLIWYVAASTAAGRDLGRYFVDRWRLPLSPSTRKALARAEWGAIHPAALLDNIPIEFRI